MCRIESRAIVKCSTAIIADAAQATTSSLIGSHTNRRRAPTIRREFLVRQWE
jgi:hypothetical protein